MELLTCEKERERKQSELPDSSRVMITQTFTGERQLLRSLETVRNANVSE